MAVSLLVPAVDNDLSDAKTDRYGRRLRMAALLRNAARRGSGGTVDPRHGRFDVLDRGYLVSIRRFGRRFARLPSISDITRWLADCDIEAISDDERLFVGIWRHPVTSDIYCDVNILIDGRTEAMRRGALEDQHSIFDLCCSCARPVNSIAAAEKPAAVERSTS